VYKRQVQQQNHIAEQFRRDRNHGQSVNIHSYYAVAPVGSPPPEPSGGVLAFPHNATKIFPLKQNSLSLTFHATKSQPHNPRIWRRLKRIFAMLAKERKEAKEVLWEFLGFDDDAGNEVGICAEVLMLRKWFEEWVLRFEKSPPHDFSTVWLFATILRFRRAPNPTCGVAG